jgi:hypothetical protein
MMIHIERDLSIAVAMFLVGLAGIAWGWEDIALNQETFAAIAAVVGGFLLVFGVLMTFNFLLALFMRRDIVSGRKAFANWIVPADVVERFVAAEAARGRPWSEWRPNQRDRRDGLAVHFAPETIVVGGALLSIPSSGMQSMRAIRIEPGDPPVLEMQTHMYAARSGGDGGITSIRGALRTPAPDLVSAEEIRAWYQEVLDGRNVIAPNRWTSRIKGGVIAAAVGAAVFLVGLGLYVVTGDLLEGPAGPAPLLAMIFGALIAVCGLIIASVASGFRRRQFSGR